MIVIIIIITIIDIFITIGDTVWTAHDVEIALWSYTIAKRLRPSLLEEKQVTRPNARPRTPTSDNDSLPPHAKRTNNN